MVSKANILNIVYLVGGIVLSIGIIVFLTGFFGSDTKLITSIGIGTIVGAVFIFLIGVFFVATEEALEKINTKQKSSLKGKKRAPL